MNDTALIFHMIDIGLLSVLEKMEAMLLQEVRIVSSDQLSPEVRCEMIGKLRSNYFSALAEVGRFSERQTENLVKTIEICVPECLPRFGLFIEYLELLTESSNCLSQIAYNNTAKSLEQVVNMIFEVTETDVYQFSLRKSANEIFQEKVLTKKHPKLDRRDKMVKMDDMILMSFEIVQIRHAMKRLYLLVEPFLTNTTPDFIALVGYEERLKHTREVTENHLRSFRLYLTQMRYA